MEKEKDTSQDFLNIVGKDKLQAFQDAFAATFGISFCFLSIDGEPITVWSNYPMFCHGIAQKNKERCQLEEKKIRELALKTKKDTVYNCYMGLKVFIIPIIREEKIIALAYGSGLILEGSTIKEPGKFDIIYLSEEKFRKMLELLKSSMNLISEGTVYKKKEFEYGNLSSLIFMRKKLTLREMEIVDLINKGKSNKEIADILNISDKTVKTHVTNILRKLKLKDRLQLILFCKENESKI